MVDSEWDSSQQESTKDQSKVKLNLTENNADDDKGSFNPKWDLLVKNNVDGTGSKGNGSKRSSQYDEGDVGSTR